MQITVECALGQFFGWLCSERGVRQPQPPCGMHLNAEQLSPKVTTEDSWGCVYTKHVPRLKEELDFLNVLSVLVVMLSLISTSCGTK